MDDDPSPMSAEESLNLIAQQNRRLRRELGGGPARMFAAWALAYIIGWGLAYVSVQPGSPVPGWVSAVVTGVLILGAIVATAYYSARAGRGIRGRSRLIGAMYGWSWAIGFTGLWVINYGITRAAAMPLEQISLLWTGSSLLVVGLLYLAGGMIFEDRLFYGLGGWMIVSAAAGVLVGYPANFLVLAACGGGGFLLASIVYFLREWRGKPVRR